MKTESSIRSSEERVPSAKCERLIRLPGHERKEKARYGICDMHYLHSTTAERARESERQRQRQRQRRTKLPSKARRARWERGAKEGAKEGKRAELINGRCCSAGCGCLVVRRGEGERGSEHGQQRQQRQQHACIQQSRTAHPPFHPSTTSTTSIHPSIHP